VLPLFKLINKVLKLKASLNGHIELVKVLLTKNANIEAKTNLGQWTPLICGKVYLLELYSE
jgi:hypothetical protein